MNRLRNKILSVMTDSDPRNKKPLPFLLYLFSRIYKVGVGLRSIAYDWGMIRQKKLPCRVISIGNLAVGGTGKTPMAIYMAKVLISFGLRPVVISRGYKGSLEKKGGIISDGIKILSHGQRVGDEPLMMAHALKGVPVMVGSNRFEVGKQAIRDFKADVIVLDDGFQHRRLFRDMDLVLIDDKTFFGNGHLLPRGNLREPVTALGRCHACVLTRSLTNQSGNLETLQHMFPGKEIFRAFHVPYIYGIFSEKMGHVDRHTASMYSDDFSFLKDKSVFVFSGIANNVEFLEMVSKKVKAVTGFREFPDHHPYSRRELEEIIRSSKQSGATAVITTEKDFSRLDGQTPEFNNLVVMGVQISMGDDEERFRRFIRQRIQ